MDEVLEEGGAIVNTIFQQIREESEEKKQIRIALNCLMKGMDVQTIAELTELPIERIESLKATLSQENTTHL